LKNVCLTTNNYESSLREIKLYYLSVEFTGTNVSLVYDCRTTFNLPITSCASTLFLVASNLAYYTINQTIAHRHNNIWVYYIIHLPTEFSTVDILFENKKTCLIRRLIICNIQLLINLIPTYVISYYIVLYYIVQQVTIIKTYQCKVQPFSTGATLVDL